MDFDGNHCVECGGLEFQLVNDSILKRKYPFVRGDNLKLCVNCGAKYITCDNCGNLFTRVHLSHQVPGVTDKCENCNTTNDQVSQWVKHGIESFGNL
ncbi:MAG: hypothetical protein ACFFBP_00180 [Promethearchaeota archaeon]